MRRLSQGIVNYRKVKVSGRMMPKNLHSSFSYKLWLESISLFGKLNDFFG
jgi:hypothetical protein